MDNSPDEDIKKLRNDPLFMEALKNVPDADVNLLNQKGCNLSQEELRFIIAMRKWKNKVCNLCGNPTPLKLCSQCRLAFYCDDKCQSWDWRKHKLRCCKKDGPLDDGHNAIIGFSKNKN